MKIYRCKSCGEEFRLEMAEDVEADDLYCPNCGTSESADTRIEELRVDWVVMGGKLGEVGYCTRCGEGLEMQLPLPVDMAVALMNEFCWRHRGCPPDMKYEEPEIKTPKDWIESRDVGVSSIAIWTVMTGEKHPHLERGKSYQVRWSNEPPRDVADFGRCYRLLNYFPEWRPQMEKMSARFPWWKPHVEHWTELMALYEGTLAASGLHPLDREKASRALYDRLKQCEQEAKAPVQG